HRLHDTPGSCPAVDEAFHRRRGAPTRLRQHPADVAAAYPSEVGPRGPARLWLLPVAALRRAGVPAKLRAITLASTLARPSAAPHPPGRTKPMRMRTVPTGAQPGHMMGITVGRLLVPQIRAHHRMITPFRRWCPALRIGRFPHVLAFGLAGLASPAVAVTSSLAWTAAALAWILAVPLFYLTKYLAVVPHEGGHALIAKLLFQKLDSIRFGRDGDGVTKLARDVP